MYNTFKFFWKNVFTFFQQIFESALYLNGAPVNAFPCISPVLLMTLAEENDAFVNKINLKINKIDF